jgi:serine phosphatase RsbU (regulator of sigma subunit)
VHETKKQRETREAREAAEEQEEDGGGLEKALSASGSGRQPSAAGGVSNIEGGSPTAQPASASAVASAHTGHAARASHARAHAPRRSGSAAGSHALALGAGAALAGTGQGSGEGGGAGGAPHASGTGHDPSSRKGESTIVRTVTQIVGVIPTLLWLLIGVLALAAAAFAVASRVAARRARRLDRQRRVLLEDVGLLQAALLPELPERLGPVATSAAYRPASGPGAGGDFYDVFALPEGLLAVIVGDVSGHGREALPHTTLLRYTLRVYMEAGLAPREALRAAAPALERQLGGSFATVVLASWDPRGRRLTYACAGHPHPIVSGLDPSASILAASAPPIGAGNSTGSRQTVMTIPGAGTACFYTDGVIEARASGELYGSARLASALAALRTQHADTRPEADELLDRVAAETDRRPDDMAACLLELAGEDEAPRILREELLLDAREAGGKRAHRFLEAAGVSEPELGASLDRARTVAAEHGSALLTIDLAGERPRVSVLQDNIAPLRARALARTQEVAL